MGTAGSPWWQTAKTPKQGFLLGGVWLLLVVTYVVFSIRRPISWSIFIAALAALLAVGHLVSAVLLLRARAGRRRTGEESE